MRFSEALLRKVKQCDLTAYIKGVIPDITFEKHGNYYTACCPHPDHDDEHPSFRVWHNTDDTWSFCCMACHSGTKDIASAPGKRNYGTDIIAFIQWMSDHKGSQHIFTFEEAVVKALQFFRIPVPEQVSTPVSKQELYFQKLAQLYHRYFMLYDSEPKKYYKTRGLNQQDAVTWQIGSDGDRLIFPLFDGNHALKGFIKRTICNEEPKYIHSSAREGFIKSEYLYGLDHFNRSIQTAMVTEGVLDVISAVKYGVNNVCATLGTAFMVSHASLLKRNGIREVIFVFDGDAAGQKATQHAIKIARDADLSVRIIILPDHEDLDSFCQKHQYKSRQKLEALQQYDYEYELRDYIQEYQAQRSTLQNKYLYPILSKAASIRNHDDYAVFRTYILNQFDIRLEQRNVREIKTDLAHPLPVKTQTTSQTSTKASA